MNQARDMCQIRPNPRSYCRELFRCLDARLRCKNLRHVRTHAMGSVLRMQDCALVTYRDDEQLLRDSLLPETSYQTDSFIDDTSHDSASGVHEREVDTRHGVRELLA